jgi:hypothetical protein
MTKRKRYSGQHNSQAKISEFYKTKGLLIGKEHPFNTKIEVD